MNVLLFGTSTRKKYEALEAFKKHTIVAIRKDIDTKKTFNDIENINPHIIFFEYKNVKSKSIDIKDFIILAKNKIRQKIIFIFDDYEKNKNDLKFLIEQGIYNISLKLEDIEILLEKDFSKEDIEEIIKEREIKKEVYIEKEDILKEEKEEVNKIDLTFSSLNEKFNIEETTKIIDISNSSTKETIIISLAELQHHLGCTHTAFEIASTLSNVCIVMADEKTYNNMVYFYRIRSDYAKEGISLKDIPVYPFSELDKVKALYRVIIVDIGFLYKEETFEKIFKNSDIKIMLCSASSWDLNMIEKWVNYPDPKYNYITQINYMFHTSTHQFVKINKVIQASGCKAYRLHSSDDCFTPHTINKKVYSAITKNYNISSTPIKQKNKFKKLVRLR